MHKILQKINEISMELNIPVYLVGGYVRDLILRKANDDIDFLVQGNPKELAKTVADRLKGSYFLLDDTFQILARVVLKVDKQKITFDFAGLTEGNIADNLVKRDFTINSLAVSLADFTASNEISQQNIISSCPEGLDDLAKQLIRVNGPNIFNEDPLRMLRAYRFSAIYGFKITDETLELIRENCELIKKVSGERIRDELFKLLKSTQSSEYIKQMWEIGLLDKIFPEIASLENTEQNGYHSLNVWEHCLQAIIEYEKSAWKELLSQGLEEIEEYLAEEVTKGRTKEQLLKFALLFHDVGKPDTKGVKEDGRITFYGHDDVGGKLIKNICNRLIMSNDEKHFIAHLTIHHMRPLLLFNVKKRTDTAIRKFFHKVQPEALGLILHAFADKSASTGPLQDEETFVAFKSMLSKLNHLYRVEKLFRDYQPIFSGKDLIDRFNLPPGPFIGEVLKALEKEYLEQGIMTQEQALQFCKTFINKRN